MPSSPVQKACAPLNRCAVGTVGISGVPRAEGNRTPPQRGRRVAGDRPDEADRVVAGAPALTSRRRIPMMVAFLAAWSSASAAHPYGGEAALGSAFFRDKNLSVDRTVACISCHQPNHAFADDRAVSFGAHHRLGTRHAPSLLDLRQYTTFFWDGRAPTLAAQIRFPFLTRQELGFTRIAPVIARVERNRAYVRALRRLHPGVQAPIRFGEIAEALVAYEQSLATPPSPFDRYQAGDRAALSPAARRGLHLFRGKAGCASCHLLSARTAPLTDNRFHRSAVGLSALGPQLASLAVAAARLSPRARFRAIASDAPLAALGRYLVTLNPQDIGKFRTPSLRHVAQAGPYMHDGSVARLRQAVAIELYYRGLQVGHPIILSTEDRDDLMAFLQSLSSSPRVPPAVFPAGAQAAGRDPATLTPVVATRRLVRPSTRRSP